MQEIGAAWISVREAVPDHVTVVAVSKTKPVEAVVAAHAAGARVFGENRVQELVGMIDQFVRSKGEGAISLYNALM